MNAPDGIDRYSTVDLTKTSSIAKECQLSANRKVNSALMEDIRLKETTGLILLSGELCKEHLDIWEKEFPNSSLVQIIESEIIQQVRKFVTEHTSSYKNAVYTDNTDELNQELFVRLGWLQYNNWKKYGKEVIIPKASEVSNGKGLVSRIKIMVRGFISLIKVIVLRVVNGEQPIKSNKPQEYFTRDYGPTDIGKRIIKDYKAITKHGK